ncbi:flagellar hook-length control protein FliK [Bdellovibrio svalbardensis]|uniref:Flagellar hook-length control protein FliK n=1 Tax=Bdellovibrio svalbardensis TaxID=2972972 RepID=A0ABT6DEU9_9BACT|nr:flagellar hook-length control protein FliK [Bdellovibrio svalbardensis]MDG0815362.1 flagellar hook-length control protein FliK [Bdellovibrio svalbardensis]
MLANIVGPPMVGATDLRSSPDKAIEKNLKGSSSESSFGKALQDKISVGAQKETKDLPRQEVRAKDSARDSKESNSRKEDKAQKPEDRAEQKVAKPDGTLKKKSANRQQAIKEFMDSFESEFEIPPTRLVEAMAQLDDSQLKESPEATADAVVDKLGLDDAQADKARAMYAALLTQLQQTPQSPKAPPEMAAGLGMSSSQNMQMRVAAAQEKQNALGTSLESFNKKFWMKPEAAAEQTAMPTLDGNLAQRMSMDDGEEGMDLTDSAMDSEVPGSAMPEAPQMKMPELPPHLQGQMKDAMSPALLAALAAKKAAASQQAAAAGGEAEDAPELSEEFMQALEAPRMEKPLQGPQMNNIQGKAAAQEFFQNESQGQSLMQNSKEFMQQGMGQEKEAAKGKLTAKSAEFKSTMTGLEGLQAQPLKGEALKFDPMTPMAPVAPGQVAGEKNEAAVKQLMNQAQYLIKNGGGEVKVEMTPEGMGTIHLKVMLQDGKVNLQMSADTQEAKKTIESSLAELKTSLAAHKLSMENVKVDVVNSTSTDTATQNQPNMNGQGQNNKEARQFWNQFNDNFGNQGRRESFGEFQNIKGYGGKSRDPLQPIDSAGAKTASRAVEGKGSGLNLVA